MEHTILTKTTKKTIVRGALKRLNLSIKDAYLVKSSVSTGKFHPNNIDSILRGNF